MSKYQEVMNHIEVDDEMKKRILQNVQSKLEEAPEADTTKADITKADIPGPKVVHFRRYAAIAATFAVLLLGSYAVMQVTGGIGNMATSTSVYEEAASSSEAPAMEETAEAQADNTGKKPVMEASAKPATPAINQAATSEISVEPVGVIVISTLLAALVLTAIIMFVIKKKR